MEEIIKGTEFNDNGIDKPELIGNDPKWIQGPNGPVLTLGADTIYGYAGNDVLSGLGGDDVLYGGSGEDRLYGGSGKDKLYGGTQKDQLFGGKGNDLLYGGLGGDLLYGEAGSDKLYGEAGDDALSGGTGYDTLIGGTGKDYLDGFGSGKEYDILTGGTEADTFALGSSGSNSPYYLGAGYATITDFNKVQGDKIQLLDLGSNNIQYSLGSGNWQGGNALDTGVFYKGDLIGVVQDTTNVSFQQDFTFVQYIAG